MDFHLLIGKRLDGFFTPLTPLAVFSLFSYCLCQPLIADTKDAAAPETNSTLQFDFVNLPGYGIIDDANNTMNSSFNCYGRRYGYYADVVKNCTMFHLCYPVEDQESKEIFYQRYSFICSDESNFDQQLLLCMDNETLSTECSQSPDYFESSNYKLIESLQQQSPEYLSTLDSNETSSEAAGPTYSDDNAQQASNTYNFFDSWTV